MQDFHQLNVWKKAHGLVLQVYKASNDLAASENYFTTNLMWKFWKCAK